MKWKGVFACSASFACLVVVVTSAVGSSCVDGVVRQCTGSGKECDACHGTTVTSGGQQSVGNSSYFNWTGAFYTNVITPGPSEVTGSHPVLCSESGTCSKALESQFYRCEPEEGCVAGADSSDFCGDIGAPGTPTKVYRTVHVFADCGEVPPV
jgi:hypothetical protein